MSATKLPTLPAATVAKSNTSKSCYVTIGVNVYDVTNFIEDHPGGADLILKYAGQDVEEIMKDEESHVHPESAYEILNANHIGYVATEPVRDALLEIDNPADIVPLIPNDTGKDVIEANGAARADLGGREVFNTTSLKKPEELIADFDTKEDFRIHKFLDLDKPLLMQIWRSGLTKEEYLKQVHIARHYKGSAPLFGNFLEPLSLTPFWVVPLLWLPCVAWGTYVANQGLEPLETLAYWLIGLSLWSLVEYGMHRGLFHVDKYLPDNRVGITAHFLLHGIHHFLPMDKYRLVMPPALFFVLAIPFLKLAHAVFFWDWFAARAVFCGGIFGYICYDETHYFLHHKNLKGYYKQLREYHMAHHYQDSGQGFGVTSKFWDIIFGTELILKPKPKPKPKPMANGKANGMANGKVNGTANGKVKGKAL